MQAKKKNLARIIPAGIVIAFLLVLTVWNAHAPWRSFKLLLRGDVDFPGFVTQLQEDLSDSFTLKYDFINLNGRIAAALDQTVCNEVVRLENNTLLKLAAEADVPAAAEKIVAFNDYLADLDVPYLYAAAPYKVDLQNKLLPEGISDNGNANTDEMLALLEAGGVNTMDLRPALSATAEQATQNFYITDHHWNHAAALAGARLIGEELREMFPEREIDLRYADPSLWESHTLENWFLGSEGKRVGLYFDGTDDVTYYTPAFDADITCVIPGHLNDDRQLFKGSFEDATIRGDLYFDAPDYFNDSPYFLYFGAGRPLIELRNPGAPNDLHILMFADSFSMPVAAYFSTMFQQIEMIDPRYTADATIAEFVKYFQPDVVLQLQAARAISDYPEEFEFGTDIGAALDFDARRTAMEPRDVTVGADGYASIPEEVEPGSTYILRFDDIEFTAGSSEGTTAGLFDADTGKQLLLTAWDCAISRADGRFEWFLTIPGDAGGDLEFRLCAGLLEDIGGCEAVYRGVELEQIG